VNEFKNTFKNFFYNKNLNFELIIIIYFEKKINLMGQYNMNNSLISSIKNEKSNKQNYSI